MEKQKKNYKKKFIKMKKKFIKNYKKKFIKKLKKRPKIKKKIFLLLEQDFINQKKWIVPYRKKEIDKKNPTIFLASVQEI